MKTPSALPVTGTTFTSMSGIGARKPGSGILVRTFAVRPSMENFKSVPFGDVRWTVLPPVKASPIFWHTGTWAAKSVSRRAGLVMTSSV